MSRKRMERDIFVDSWWIWTESAGLNFWPNCPGMDRRLHAPRNCYKILPASWSSENHWWGPVRYFSDFHVLKYWSFQSGLTKGRWCTTQGWFLKTRVSVLFGVGSAWQWPPCLSIGLRHGLRETCTPPPCTPIHPSDCVNHIRPLDDTYVFVMILFLIFTFLDIRGLLRSTVDSTYCKLYKCSFKRIFKSSLFTFH